MTENTFHLRFHQHLKEATGVSREQLDGLDAFSEDTIDRVLAFILDYGCQSQHVANIEVAREAMQKVPQLLIPAHLSKVIEDAIDLNDSWQVRRLLEMLELVSANQLARVVAIAKVSPDAEVREAALDFEKSA